MERKKKRHETYWRDCDSDSIIESNAIFHNNMITSCCTWRSIILQSCTCNAHHNSDAWNWVSWDIPMMRDSFFFLAMCRYWKSILRVVVLLDPSTLWFEWNVDLVNRGALPSRPYILWWLWLFLVGEGDIVVPSCEHGPVIHQEISLIRFHESKTSDYPGRKKQTLCVRSTGLANPNAWFDVETDATNTKRKYW